MSDLSGYSGSTTRLAIYTDGACIGNPGPGGWGLAVFDAGTIVHEQSGAMPATTNNRMELTAILVAIGLAHQHRLRCEILSDSEYAIKGITQWLPGWKRNHWRTAAKKPVANEDIWRQIDAHLAAFGKPGDGLSMPTFSWVKGHASIRGNEHADRLANNAARSVS